MKRQAVIKPSIELSTLINRPWCMEEKYFRFLVALGQANALVGLYQADDEDDVDDADEKPYEVTDDGIACIPVSGPLTDRSSYWGNTTAYSEIREMAADAYADDDIKGVLFRYNSPGGEGSSQLFELTDFLFAMRAIKPTVAIAHDQCYSAAFCLASTAPKLFTGVLGGTGSVGCWTAHVDVSKMFAKEGIAVTYIYSGAKKVDGNPHEPLSDQAHAEMQAETDNVRDMFVAAVARNRSVSADALYATEAGTYTAAKGIPLLCDGVGTQEDALNYLRGQIAMLNPVDDDECDPDNPNDPNCPDNEDQYGNQNSTNAIGGKNADVPHRKYGSKRSASKKEDKDRSAALTQHSGELGSTVSDLLGTAFGPGHCGWADYAYSEKQSMALFGAPGVSLSVRRFPECRSSAHANDRRISMLVVPYDGSASSNLGGFKEIYQAGCFKTGLNNDPRAVFNHSDGHILGRKSAGTATFWEDAEGVHVECDAPKTSWADDLLESMRRTDITGSSATFWIVQQRWETRNGEKFRIVEKALLRDASVHAFPAYESTQASVQPVLATTENTLYQYELEQARLALLTIQ